MPAPSAAAGADGASTGVTEDDAIDAEFEVKK